MDTKKDQETVAKILSTPLNSIARMSKENLSPELAEIIAREQVRMQKDRKNSFRATLASNIASGLCANPATADMSPEGQEHVASCALGIADKIIEEVNRE